MEVNFLSVGCGDGIHIRFLGDEGFYCNIIIDGGVEKGEIYPSTLRKVIEEIASRNETIDLWIITHIDDDHIGGLLRFIKDIDLHAKINLSGTVVWYNHSIWDYDAGIKSSNLKSVRQGMCLREYLLGNAIVNEFISDDAGTIHFRGIDFTILSPNHEQLATLITKWEKEEVKIRSKTYIGKKKAEVNDYGKKLEEFDLHTFTEDDSEENGSSIAFILSFKGRKALFLADSYPSQVSKALRKLGYAKENPLTIEFAKISHHGSKYNTNDELLELISCSRFIISADGYGHNLPNKETLARIWKNITTKPITFYFTHQNASTRQIFKVDGDLPEINVGFPASGANGIILSL